MLVLENTSTETVRVVKHNETGETYGFAMQGATGFWMIHDVDQKRLNRERFGTEEDALAWANENEDEF